MTYEELMNKYEAEVEEVEEGKDIYEEWASWCALVELEDYCFPIQG